MSLLFGLCLVAPVFVLFGLVVEGQSAWAVVGAVGTQVLGAAIAAWWLVQVTPRSYSVYLIARRMRQLFRVRFAVDPTREDLEDVIAELDKPALTTGQHLLDFVIERSPVKWAVLLLIAALGVNILPLLDSGVKPEDVNSVRLPAGVIGLLFGFVEVMRLSDRLLHSRRLAGAREWLHQVRAGVFPREEGMP